MPTIQAILDACLPDPAAEWRYRKALCRDAYQRGRELAGTRAAKRRSGKWKRGGS